MFWFFTFPFSIPALFPVLFSFILFNFLTAPLRFVFFISFFLLTFRPSFINPPTPQVLGSSSKPGGVSAELHEVHRQFAVPPLPLHCGLRLVGDAAVWRTVSVNTHFQLKRAHFFALTLCSCLSLCMRLGWCDSTSFYYLLLRFNFEDGTPPTNFDTFAAAIMTVFQVGKRDFEDVQK